MTISRDIRHLKTTASVYKNGFLVASYGTKYATRQGNTHQILLSEPAFELCAPTNTTSVSKRPSNTCPQHAPQPKQVFLLVSLGKLMRHAQVCLMNLGQPAPQPAGTSPEGRPASTYRPSWDALCCFSALFLLLLVRGACPVS